MQLTHAVLFVDSSGAVAQEHAVPNVERGGVSQRRLWL
jgi:hypothetical protein